MLQRAFAVVGSPDVISSARLLSEINNEKLHLSRISGRPPGAQLLSAVLRRKSNLVITDMCCAGIADSFKALLPSRSTTAGSREPRAVEARQHRRRFIKWLARTPRFGDALLNRHLHH